MQKAGIRSLHREQQQVGHGGTSRPTGRQANKVARYATSKRPVKLGAPPPDRVIIRRDKSRKSWRAAPADPEFSTLISWHSRSALTMSYDRAAEAVAKFGARLPSRGVDRPQTSSWSTYTMAIQFSDHRIRIADRTPFPGPVQSRCTQVGRMRFTDPAFTLSASTQPARLDRALSTGHRVSVELGHIDTPSSMWYRSPLVGFGSEHASQVVPGSPGSETR